MKSDQHFKYEVCLSYAEEDKKFVEGVARVLKRKNIKVFFDRDNEIEAWGKDLYEYLHSVFYKESRYCVIFISKHYKKKWWPIRERKIIYARALKELDEYILPYKIDDTVLPGEIDTTFYLKNKSSEELAGAIMGKIGKREIEPTKKSRLVIYLKYFLSGLALAVFALSIFYIVHYFTTTSTSRGVKPIVRSIYLTYNNLDFADKEIEFSKIRINGTDSSYNFSKALPGAFIYDNIPSKYFNGDSAVVSLRLSDLQKTQFIKLITDTIRILSEDIPPDVIGSPIDDTGRYVLEHLEPPVKTLSLEGQVVDESNQSISGVKVRGPSNIHTETNESGYYKLEFLNKKKREGVSIIFEKEGYENITMLYYLPKDNAIDILKKKSSN